MKEIQLTEQKLKLLVEEYNTEYEKINFDDIKLLDLANTIMRKQRYLIRQLKNILEKQTNTQY